MDLNEKLSDHFTLGELLRSETAVRQGLDNTPPDEYLPKLKRLCDEILEPVRQQFNQPFRPNSGYRSSAVNQAVGGSPSSQHCLAEAVDIEVPGVSNYDLAEWISQNIDFDQLILECYQRGIPRSGWVHVSLKPESQDNLGEVLTYTNGDFIRGLVA